MARVKMDCSKDKLEGNLAPTPCLKSFSIIFLFVHQENEGNFRYV